MKERLVEDWLTRINERGYQTSFGQILAAKGFNVLRIGHSPYEHGRDVVAVSPEGEVHCYQLKGGDIDLKEWEKGYDQIVALVETRPRHPSLATEYTYRPFLVTNGLFTDPALDRLSHHNAEWRRRSFPRLEIIDGRWLSREFVSLSIDFWPESPPDVRAFRALYLADGRGDFDAEAFALFIEGQLSGEIATPVLERRTAAVNLFSSYVLAEFYRNADHWTVFRGWTMSAARIAWAVERSGTDSPHMIASFTLAKGAAQEALESLAVECEDPKAFKPMRIEWDEYTRIRNTAAMAAWTAWCLTNPQNLDAGERCVALLENFVNESRITVWGEGSLSQFCCFWWLLERHGRIDRARSLMISFLKAVVWNQQRDNPHPLTDPYTSAEQTLKRIVESFIDNNEKRPTSVQSYCLFPLVLLLVNRGLRSELGEIWQDLSRVTMTTFSPKEPLGYLEWSCQYGSEIDHSFFQPQSWQELVNIASTPPTGKLPQVLQNDAEFRLMFLLAFPHRLAWSIIGSLDHFFSTGRNSETNRNR